MLNSGTRDSVFILNLTILFQALLLASHVHQMLTAQLRPVTMVKSLSVMAVHVTVTMWTNATTPTTAHAQTMKQLHVIITIAIVPRHKLKSKFINPIINLKSCFISLSLSLHMELRSIALFSTFVMWLPNIYVYMYYWQRIGLNSTCSRT